MKPRTPKKALFWLVAVSPPVASCPGSEGIGAVPVRIPAPASAPMAALQPTLGQLPSPDIDGLLEHVKKLSSDEFEGRAPGTKGEELSVAYLIDEFKKVGLKPGNTDGTYVQKVPLVGITPTPAPLVFKKGSAASGVGAPAKTMSLKWKDDVVAWTKH